MLSEEEGDRVDIGMLLEVSVVGVDLVGLFDVASGLVEGEGPAVSYMTYFARPCQLSIHF